MSKEVFVNFSISQGTKSLRYFQSNYQKYLMLVISNQSKRGNRSNKWQKSVQKVGFLQDETRPNSFIYIQVYFNSIRKQIKLLLFVYSAIEFRNQIHLQIFVMRLKQASLGSKLTIAQEQYNHMKRLNQICHRPPMITSNTYQSNYDEDKYRRLVHSRSAKINNYQEVNHIRNIKHLIQRLNSPKNIQDRIKDPHDFFAYPALFFRQIPQKKVKVKIPKTKENIKPKKLAKHSKPNNRFNIVKSEDQSKYKKIKEQESQKHNGLTFKKVKQQIPFLYFFQQDNLQQFADALTKLIFNYNLNTIQNIQFLYECVQKAMPPTYPQQFRNAVDEMFNQIAQSLGIK